MNYTIEDVSPIAKKVTIVVGKEEVNAAISATVALYKSDNKVSVPGFRQGHIPSGVIESRFRKHVYAEAREDLVNIQLNKLPSEMNLTPVHQFSIDSVSDFERDKDFTLVASFEVFPEITLPPYEGLSIRVERLKPNPNYLSQALEGIRRKNAQLVPIEGNGPAVDQQVVNIDFCLINRKGEELRQFTEKNVDYLVDKRQFLPEVYALVKSTPIGRKVETEVHFPKNFVNKSLAGQKLTGRLQINAIKNIVLPELTPEFLEKHGYKDQASLEEQLLASEKKNLDLLLKSKVEKELAEQLLKLCDFPVPNYYCQTFLDLLFSDYTNHLAHYGRTVENVEEVKANLTKQAQHDARIFMLLVAIARKENLSVPDKVVEQAIVDDANAAGQDPKQVRDYYERTNLIFFLRDRLLADKASLLLYERANITITEPADKDEALQTSGEDKPVQPEGDEKSAS